ncbi:MAG: hypothetical protein AAF327_00270 [Cyanobacteria bacterium P01_A01_bin.37]
MNIKHLIDQIYSSKKISRAQQAYLMSSLLSNEIKIQDYRVLINQILEATQAGHVLLVD